ncbi:hypothetical protein B0J18DRAFT_140319 [Chaetomium sp. MPI-SDFR-AT-0129]|nr:hypothetical protein B0J18DRAFT_140319 [Chaetomium sp. MPI-SDFR-AT-0129]
MEIFSPFADVSVAQKRLTNLFEWPPPPLSFTARRTPNGMRLTRLSNCHKDESSSPFGPSTAASGQQRIIHTSKPGPEDCHNPVSVSGLLSWPGTLGIPTEIPMTLEGRYLRYRRGKCLAVFAGRLRSCVRLIRGRFVAASKGSGLERQIGNVSLGVARHQPRPCMLEKHMLCSSLTVCLKLPFSPSPHCGIGSGGQKLQHAARRAGQESRRDSTNKTTSNCQDSRYYAVGVVLRQPWHPRTRLAMSLLCRPI